MSFVSIDIPLAIISTVLALLSFCGEAWRLWRDRPRLSFYVHRITFTNLPKVGEMEFVRLTICNIGYRPIILTKFMAFGENSLFSMGIDDEPFAAFGKEKQMFPSIVEPGQSIKIHPTTPDIIERNAKKPQDEKTYYDPWRYLALVDSFGRLHPLDIEDVKWHLQLSSKRIRPRRWRKVLHSFAKWRFLRDARRPTAQPFP